MTQRRQSAAKKTPAKKAAPRKRAGRTPKPPEPAAGTKLIEALSKPDDPYEVTFLIEQAALHADYIERLRWLLSGETQSWLSLRLGAKVVEVTVNAPLREARQQSEQLRRLLADIARRQAQLEDPDEDDVLDDDDD